MLKTLKPLDFRGSLLDILLRLHNFHGMQNAEKNSKPGINIMPTSYMGSIDENDLDLMVGHGG